MCLKCQRITFQWKKGSKFSHLLTGPRGLAPDSPPPYGQPDCKISGFFTPPLSCITYSYVTSRLFNLFSESFWLSIANILPKILLHARKLEIELELYFISVALSEYICQLSRTLRFRWSRQGGVLATRLWVIFSLFLSLFSISGMSYFSVYHFLPAPNKQVWEAEALLKSLGKMEKNI